MSPLRRDGGDDTSFGVLVAFDSELNAIWGFSFHLELRA